MSIVAPLPGPVTPPIPENEGESTVAETLSYARREMFLIKGNAETEKGEILFHLMLPAEFAQAGVIVFNLSGTKNVETSYQNCELEEGNPEAHLPWRPKALRADELELIIVIA